MQLSLPAASFPTPAAAPACGGKNSPAPSDNADTPAGSFDSLLKQDSTGDDAKDDNGKTSTDAEQAAGILAAMLWMQNPAATTKIPVLPSVLADGSTTPAATEASVLSDTGDSVTTNAQATTTFFGATNSRAFGKVQIAGAQTQATPFNSIVAGQTPEASPVGQGTPVIVPSSTALTGEDVKCAADVRMPVDAGVSTTTAQNSLSTASTVVADQMGATISGAANQAISTTAKTPVKIAPDGKLPVVAAEDDSEGKSEPVVSVSFGVEKPLIPTAATQSKQDPLPVASPADGAQEKIAPLPAVLKDLEKSAAKAVEKYFLEPAQKVVTAASASVGIAVAKVNAAMSSAPSARTKVASLIEPSAAFVFSADTAPTATLTVDAPAPVATVRETLAAVISAVDAIERRADVQQKSVDLNFHVGNEKLGLRVELKDGAVHTTFRTESPEMNSALAREWHSVVPTAFAREVRLAEPVFHTVATQGSDSSSTSLGQGAQHQQREQPKAAPTFASALRREFNDSPAQETTASATSSAANSSQLLNALA